ncbi:MAG: RagB/SusD family nutrient uptake outer membrane protein [Tannerella sp.]|jgi:hypothetical protein|nr:RagB/SusD family nutrient uptake outer membrane protein [Tannerella sp.]
MKKLLFILVIGLASVSCNDLDIDPIGSISQQRFFSSDRDAVSALNGVYQALTYTEGEQALYGRNLYFLTDMGTDYAAAGAAASNFHVQSISQLAYDANNDRVALVWKQIYNGINRANIAIDNIPEIPVTSESDLELRAHLVNEAKFIRALLYFTAVRLWSDVPLVLHEPETLDNKFLKVERTPKEKVYEQIISDLTDAQALKPIHTGADLGRPTKGAAVALLAEVYLTRKEYDKAAATAKSIIDDAGVYGYKLVDNFDDLFTKPDKKNGPEHVFSVQFENGQNGTTGSTGNTLVSVCYYGPTLSVEPPDISTSDAVGYDRFAAGDTRRDVSYVKEVKNPATGAVLVTFPRALFIKYVSSIYIDYRLRSSDPINFPVLRYADVLLIYAEAVNERNGAPTAEAYEAINQVRRRAFGKLPVTTPNADVDLSGLNHDDFLKAVQDERFFEFVQEGKRWFDLVRWGKLVEFTKDVEFKGQKFKAAVSERNNLYPIPQEQRDLNPELYQNEGY